MLAKPNNAKKSASTIGKSLNGHRQSFRKGETTHLTFEKGVITAIFYGMNWKWQAYSTMH